MKKTILILIVIIILGALGLGGWYFFLRKLPEGAVCKSTESCEAGLRCANKICSSGKVDSSCDAKADCKTNFCVNNKCTEGKRNDPCITKIDCSTNYCINGKCTEGKKGDSCTTKADCLTSYCVNGKCTEGKKEDACSTYKDCEKGLFCKKGVCSEPPSYSQYFNRIVVSKMKLGIPPGPNNIPVPATEFKTTDAIEIDLVGVKSTSIGECYYEAVDPVTGEVVFTTSGYKQKLEGRDTGTGSDLPRVVGKGEFELNIYYNNEMVYTTTIKIID